MRTIDIVTSQNVVINYELAQLRERVFAFLIDFLIMVIAIIILALVFSGSMNAYFGYLVVLPIMLFYALFTEVLMDGQTPGKKALGIKVIKLNGIEPSITDYVIRWAFRSIDIWASLGSIGCMLINSTDNGQRLGDIVAGTALIKTSQGQKINLNEILNIRSIENYTPVYPQVKQFQEVDMLLLKEVMDRYNKYNNDAHTDALHNAVEIVCDKLNISVQPRDRINFIRTLIKDYVALSR